MVISTQFPVIPSFVFRPDAVCTRTSPVSSRFRMHCISSAQAGRIRVISVGRSACSLAFRIFFSISQSMETLPVINRKSHSSPLLRRLGSAGRSLTQSLSTNSRHSCNACTIPIAASNCMGAEEPFPRVSPMPRQSLCSVKKLRRRQALSIISRHSITFSGL